MTAKYLETWSGEMTMKTFAASTGGAYEFLWNGKDEDGNPIEPKTYRIELEWTAATSYASDLRSLTVVKARINREATPACGVMGRACQRRRPDRDSDGKRNKTTAREVGACVRSSHRFVDPISMALSP